MDQASGSSRTSWEDFLKAAKEILELSERINDGWIMLGNPNIMGSAYLVKKQQHNDDRDANDSQCLEEFEESSLEINDPSTVTPTPLRSTSEYHVVYSPSYAVPVLYFNRWHADGRLRTLDETWNGVHPSYSSPIVGDKWNALTQAEHPLERRPFCQMHPCRTAELIGRLVTRNAVVSWLSTVGPAVGLEVRQEYAALV